MNAIFDSRKMIRNLMCAVAALVITVLVSWSFLASTAVAPGASAKPVLHLASSKIPLEHRVFGRPEPAVLVD
jgi:hypothetical protein